MNLSPTLNHIITDTRAWTRITADDPANWYYTLSPQCLAARDQFVRVQLQVVF